MQMCKQCKSEIPENARTCTYCQSEVRQDDDDQRRLLMKMRLKITAAQMIPFAPISSTSPSLSPAISPRSGALIGATMLILISIILMPFIQSHPTTLAAEAKLEVRFSNSNPGTQGQSVEVARQSVSILDFGTQNAGQKSTKTILISNGGTVQLKWNIQANNTRWLRFDLSSGTVQPKASFQIVTVTVDTTKLLPGNYLTVLEVRSNGGTKDIKITLIVKPLSTGSTQSQKPFLCIDSARLEFGPIKVGNKQSQLLTIRNCGGQTLQWQTTVSNPLWITLDTNQNSNGLPSGQSQTINVTADTSQLSSNLSPYSGNIMFTSNGGSKTVSITVTLTSSTSLTPPILCLNTHTLDFGTLIAGETKTKQIMVSNCGGQTLTWSADPGNATWVTFDMNSGTLNAGLQQIVNVTVNTAPLQIGSNPATISFSSNGGSNTVSVALTVIPVPKITANLYPECKYIAGTGWFCSGTVTADPHNQSDVSWMSSSSGVNNIKITPQGSTLSQGSSIAITVSIPDTICPTTATINIFSSPANWVSLPWSCPAPTFTASELISCPPETATATTALYCETVTLTEDANFEGGLSWTTSSDIGATFNPPSGSLYLNKPVTVTITVSGCMNGTLSFTGPATNAPVTWSCVG